MASNYLKATFHIRLVGNNIDQNLHLIHIWCKFTSKYNIMARQSISFTKPNDDWLKNQVDNEEYSSKSELVNDLIRQARNQQIQIDWIRNKIERAENSGFTSDNKAQIALQRAHRAHKCLLKQLEVLESGIQSKAYLGRLLALPSCRITIVITYLGEFHL